MSDGRETSEFEILEATPSDFHRISRCLATAFDDDPVSVFLFPDPRTRFARLVSLYQLVLGVMASHGCIYTDADVRGAAVWQAPSPPKPGRFAEVLGTVAMLAALRTSSLRALALSRAVERLHPAEPHWYLGILGTDPAHQGQGVASRLMRPLLERCDATGSPAYLECSKERNLSFYEGHGFRVTGEVQVERGPQLWGMHRAVAALRSH